ELDADGADLPAAGVLHHVSAGSAREKLVAETDAQHRKAARAGAQKVLAEPQHPGRPFRDAEGRSADDHTARPDAVERRSQLLPLMRPQHRHLESEGALEPARVVAVQLRRPGLDDEKSRTG